MVEVAPDTDGERTLCANRDFRDHPEMVLSERAWTSSQYGPVYTCRAREGVDVEAALGRALAVLSEGVRLPAPDLPRVDCTKTPGLIVGTAAEGATVKEGSYVLIGDALHQVLDGEPRPISVKSATVKEGIFAKHARILRGLIPVRDAVRAVLRAQEANEPWGHAADPLVRGLQQLRPLVRPHQPHHGQPPDRRSHGRGDGHRAPAEPATVPGRPGLLAGRLDRGVRRRERYGQAWPGVQPAGDPPPRSSRSSPRRPTPWP